MQKRKIVYQMLALVAASGVIVSYLFGPGEVTPRTTIFTALSGLVLLGAEYFWVREAARINGRTIDAKWAATTSVILLASLVPQAILLTLAAFLWFAALLASGIMIIVLAFKLEKSGKQKDPRK